MNSQRAAGIFLLSVLLGAARGGSQATFATPTDAAGALLEALASGDYPSFLMVTGAKMAAFWSTSEPERDALDRDRFVEAARRNGIRTDGADERRTMLWAGRMEQPFPAPLVKTETGWQFDDEAGSREVALRRMRRNETAVVDVCRRFREAQFEYYAMAEPGNQAFAARIRSTPGQHDGLFWSDGEEDESPMGPPFAAAAFAERRPGDGTRPLFGYYFKILAAQGRDAAGGAQDYHTNGRLRKGFALIAWPAEYGIDGVQTFLMNHFGHIFKKDLGPGTAAIAESASTFNPDATWSIFDGRN